MRGCILEVNTEGLGITINSMFLYDFVDPHSRVEVFEKGGPTEKGAVILKWRIEARLHTCIGG